jgi:hypothetical protein
MDMNRTGIRSFLLVCAVLISTLPSIQARADDSYLTTPQPVIDQELDDLLAPIALYPDPLLAQILTASTYPGEITDAQAWLASGGAASSIDAQNWGESVKAIAHYPEVLKMMAENMDWTADLGDAFLNQPEDVTSSIQRLRAQAKAAGNLESNDKQEVAIDGNDIEIIPAQPEYIYVPVYDPTVVYVQRWTPGWPPFVAFGPRLLIGGWLALDFDWRYHHVIYHGWNRAGWVNHARPYVHIPNVYVNRSRPFIQQTWRHDAARGNPERYRASRTGSVSTRRPERTPEIRGGVTTPTRPPRVIFGPSGNTSAFSNRGNASRGTINQGQPAPPVSVGRQPASPPPPHITQRPSSPTPSIDQRPTATAPGITQRPPPPAPRAGSAPQPRPERESPQPARTPSVTFGGYRGATEAKSQSLRGQESRMSSPEVRPSPPPAGRGGGAPAPAGRSAPVGQRPGGQRR